MKIALIGFGEAGLAIATSLGRRDGDRPALRAFDIKLADDDGAVSAAMAARIATAGVEAATSPADAVGEADIVISVVTADQAATGRTLSRHEQLCADDETDCCRLHRVSRRHLYRCRGHGANRSAWP
jgi:3-hydroxyisobutyrate dehydrogenase-like beta-hydroxyacid dehydrogenase